MNDKYYKFQEFLEHNIKEYTKIVDFGKYGIDGETAMLKNDADDINIIAVNSVFFIILIPFNYSFDFLII